MAYDFARRQELARAKGFASYNDYRAASRTQRLRASAQLAAREPTYAPSNVARSAGARGGRRQVFEPSPGVTVVQTRRGDVLRSQVRRHADAGERARILVTVQTPDGPREVRLYQHGGRAGDLLADNVADFDGDVLAFIAAAISQLYEGESWAEEPEILNVAITYE